MNTTQFKFNIAEVQAKLASLNVLKNKYEYDNTDVLNISLLFLDTIYEFYNEEKNYLDDNSSRVFILTIVFEMFKEYLRRQVISIVQDYEVISLFDFIMDKELHDIYMRDVHISDIYKIVKEREELELTVDKTTTTKSKIKGAL